MIIQSHSFTIYAYENIFQIDFLSSCKKNTGYIHGSVSSWTEWTLNNIQPLVKTARKLDKLLNLMFQLLYRIQLLLQDTLFVSYLIIHHHTHTHTAMYIFHASVAVWNILLTEFKHIYIKKKEASINSPCI